MSRAGHSFDEAVAAFELSLRERGRAEATLVAYRKALGVFAVFYRETLKKSGPYVGRLQETDLQAFVDHLRRHRGLRTSSVNTHIAALHGFCRFALGKRWLRRDLAQDLKTYRPALPAAPTHLSAEQLQRLITAVDVDGRNGQRDLAIVYLLLHTGMRVGELVALGVGDVTLSQRRGKVRIRNDKGRSERVVLLNAAPSFSLFRALVPSVPPAIAPQSQVAEPGPAAVRPGHCRHLRTAPCPGSRCP